MLPRSSRQLPEPKPQAAGYPRSKRSTRFRVSRLRIIDAEYSFENRIVFASKSGNPENENAA
jgi:hypothetical protein